MPNAECSNSTFPQRRSRGASPSGSPAVRATRPASSPNTPNWSPAPAKAPSPVSETPQSELRPLGSGPLGPLPLLLLLLAAVAAPAAQPSVTLYRDTYGVPHIYGKTDADVVFGLMHAQSEDNFWQLEQDYLHALGRAAAVDGPSALASDLVTRA